jgi:pseudouridine kinase
MTKREMEILSIIDENPMISQRVLADKLKIKRSSVAVHISNLLKKGYITGKGYIVNNNPYICVLGGANIDIQGFPKKKLVYKDSNPGLLKMSLGGVGRNIAENLSLLGVPTSLVSVVGDDVYGEKILSHAREINLDMKDTLIVKGGTTSSYLSILDIDGDMALALNAMDITEKLNIEYIKQKNPLINGSKISVIDTNLNKDVIEYVITQNRNCDYFLDTVSTVKAEKIKDIIGYFHTIKPNLIEAEILSGKKIRTDKDLETASNKLLKKGVKNIFITSKEGVFYNNGIEHNFIKSPKQKPVNTTGAGDAFMAGLAYSHFYGLNIRESTENAIAASILTLLHEDTINPNISVNEINKTKKELELC